MFKALVKPAGVYCMHYCGNAYFYLSQDNTSATPVSVMLIIDLTLTKTMQGLLALKGVSNSLHFSLKKYVFHTSCYTMHVGVRNCNKSVSFAFPRDNLLGKPLNMKEV